MPLFCGIINNHRYLDFALASVHRINGLYDFSHMEDREELRLKLADYAAEHKALDDMIRGMVAGGSVNLLQIQQLKKKKLWLKDMIRKMSSSLIDDIIA